MELRFQVDDEFIARLRERLNYKSYTELARDALTLLDWASQETQLGRVILSADQKGKDPARLVLPKLEEIRKPFTSPPA